nr:hypothetical protein [uncultured Emticicia sp.]
MNQTETKFVTSPIAPDGETKGFKEFEVKDCKFLAFKHTGKPFKFKQVQVFDVAPDSLKVWLKLPLLKMQIQSATDLNYFEGAVMRTGKSIEKEFIQGFDFFVEKKDNSAKKQEIEILETQIASQRSEYNNEVGRISRELRSVEDELRIGNNNYARMSDYQKGVWQRESKNLESQIKTLEHELDRKPSLNLEDDLMRLEGLKRALISDEIRVSEDFMIWEW